MHGISIRKNLLKLAALAGAAVTAAAPGKPQNAVAMAVIAVTAVCGFLAVGHSWRQLAIAVPAGLLAGLIFTSNRLLRCVAFLILFMPLPNTRQFYEPPDHPFGVRLLYDVQYMLVAFVFMTAGDYLRRKIWARPAAVAAHKGDGI